MRRRYARPPVLEAVIDIHAAFPQSLGMEALDGIARMECERYDQVDDLWESSISVGPNAELASSDKRSVGKRLTSIDKSRVVQVRLNGLSCSRVGAYDSWEDNYKEMRRLWSTFCDRTSPSVVTRIAVRYINRIRVPESGFDFSRFFRVRPELPGEMPHSVSSFVLRLEIPQPELSNGMLRLIHGTVTDAEPSVAAFLLDLDLFQEVSIDPKGEQLWSMLEELHRRENILFEQCITDETRKLFE